MIEAFASERLEWPRLSEEEAQSLVTFLYFLNYLDKAANAEVGERIFSEKNCIRCHSVGGKGGEVGPELDPYQTQYAAPFITASLWNNGPQMLQVMEREKIPRPQFQERDVMDILAFIRTRGLSEETTRQYLPPANPVNGETLFTEKSCIRCHAVRGEGGKIGPDLALRNLKGSLSHMLSVMWNHGSNMWPRMQKERIPFPEFQPGEMSDLLAYLYFLQFQEPPGAAAVGGLVFAEKRCKSCHVPAKSYERAIGPNLAEAGLDSPFKIIAEMWNHAPKIAAKMKEGNIRWPILDKEEMRNLIAFLLSQGR
jgi:cytochrome c2